jgi:hypothetical protein
MKGLRLLRGKPEKLKACNNNANDPGTQFSGPRARTKKRVPFGPCQEQPREFIYVRNTRHFITASYNLTSMSSAPLTVPAEPDLSHVCKNHSDRMNLRNLLYTIWAINRHGGAGDAVKCYLVKA